MDESECTLFPLTLDIREPEHHTWLSPRCLSAKAERRLMSL
jgi:hypothetical protein